MICYIKCWEKYVKKSDNFLYRDFAVVIIISLYAEKLIEGYLNFWILMGFPLISSIEKKGQNKQLKNGKR